MAIPTQPSLDSLTIEALKKAGYPSVSAGDTLQLRAEDWIDEIKNDIVIACPDLKPMQAVTYGVTEVGVSRYSNPNDYLDDLSVSILDGDSGTATAVTVNTVDLASGHGFSQNDLQGRMIILTSGTGVGNCSQIKSLSTDTVTVEPNFSGSSFDGTENYLIVNQNTALTQNDIFLRDILNYPHTKGKPEFYYPVGQANADVDETGEFQLYYVPDEIYGLQIRYRVDLRLVDITSNLMGTLYRRWWNIFDQGVLWKALKNDRNSDWKDEFLIYDGLLSKLKIRERNNADMVMRAV